MVAVAPTGSELRRAALCFLNCHTLISASHLLTNTAPAGRRFLLLAAVYTLLWMITWHSASVLNVDGTASLWFLPAGLRFACLLLLGWPGLLLELCANFLVSFSNFVVSGQWPATVSASHALGLVYDWLTPSLAYAVVLMPLRHRMKDRWDLSRTSHSFLFLAAALGASSLGALAGTFPLVVSELRATDPQLAVAWAWLVGDFLGIVTLAPLLMVRAWPRVRLFLRRGLWARPLKKVVMTIQQRRREDAEVVLMTLASLGLVLAASSASWVSGGHFPLGALALLLPQIVMTLRYSLRGAVLAALLLDFGLVVLVSWLHHGESALQYQLVMLAIATVGLWLGGAVESRNRHMARNRDFANASNDLLWETDAQGTLLSLDGRLARRLSLSPGQSWRVLLERLDPAHLTAMEKALARRKSFRDLEIALLCHDNVRRWFHINGLPVWDALGGLSGYRGTATDITRAHRAKTQLDNYTQDLVAEVARQTEALQRTHNELVVEEQRLRVMLAAVPVGVLELDEEGCCRYLNANGAKLLGYKPEQATGQHFMDLVHPDDRAQLRLDWQTNRHSDEVQWLEFRMAKSNVWCTAYWAHLRQANQAPAGAIMVLADSTVRRQQEKRLWALAHHDSLTDLPNRNLFWDRCKQAMSQASRRNQGASMLWLDLDGFKSVNDQLGHAAGDALLQQVAQRLKGRVRSSDTVARMGGDEFAVIMPEVSDAAFAVVVAQEIVDSLNVVFELPQGTVYISGSVGISLYPKQATSLETWTQYADMAMYHAKRAGKNQVRVWSPDCLDDLPSNRAELWAESRC